MQLRASTADPPVMGTAILAGLFGVIGSLVGGGLSWWTQREANQREFQLAHLERDHATRNELRAACAAFITASEGFADHARELWAAMDDKAGPERVASAHAAYCSSWTGLITTLSAFRLLAPRPLGDAGVLLKKRAGQFSDQLDARHEGRKWTHAGIEQAFDALTEARASFFEAAHTELELALGTTAAS